MKFFDINGCEITKDQFISLYNDSYYIDYVDYTDRKGNKKKKRMQNYVPGLNQCSRFVENEIDRLLKEGIKSKLDVVHILAWKLPKKIKHEDSEKYSKFVYAKDWVNAEELDVTYRGRKFEIKKMADYIVSNIEALEEKVAHDPQGVLCDLESVHAVGIGPVYLVTLLYFISRGKCPIYDQFAHIAIKMITEDREFASLVTDKELEKDFKPDDFEGYKEYYLKRIFEIFGFNDYEESRDIDRALWVYGHLFSDEEPNRKRVKKYMESH